MVTPNLADIDDLALDCSNSSVLAMEWLQSCNEGLNPDIFLLWPLPHMHLNPPLFRYIPKTLLLEFGGHFDFTKYGNSWVLFLLQPSYLHNGISYTSNKPSLFRWVSARKT